MRSSAASPSPVRRSVTPGRGGGQQQQAAESGAYRVSLPRTLYGDDVNASSASDAMMTQSVMVDGAASSRRGRAGGSGMTASCHPDMGHNSWAASSAAAARPEVLFEGAAAAADGTYLQDLSDGRGMN